MNERPSPLDFIKKVSIEQRTKENESRVGKITKKLVENSGVFGGNIEEERSQQVCQEVLGEFGAGYHSVEDMTNTLKNPSATDKQKTIAKENLEGLGIGIFVAMNKTFANYSEEATETITSHLRPEEIDNLLPEQLKGVGRYVKEVDDKATDEEKRKAKEPFRTDHRNGKKNAYDENLAATRAYEPVETGDEGKNGDNGKKEMPLFMMTQDDIVTTEMMQRNKEQFHFSPPYPPWFKELKPDKQRLWMVRIKLVNGAAYKQALRNMDVEKLMFNRALDISRDELKLLLEMPKFQESMQGMFTDLLEWEDDKAKPGFRYLRLKKKKPEDFTNKEKKDNIEGLPLNEQTNNWLTHFEAYKEQLALRLDGEKDLKKIEEAYNKGKRASLESRSAVGAAWNFLYVGNLIESADVDRQLKPTEIVSDKIRTMIHPLQKALGKWGVHKEGKGKLQGITGEEEPMGGDIASWIKYHLELGDIRGDSSFRDKLKNGVIKPFPKRTLCSIVELLAVADKNKQITTMAELIKEGEKVTLGDEDMGSDLDIYSEYRDIMDGCKTAYDYLSGTAKLQRGKNEKEWARKFNADIALIRQYNSSGIDKIIKDDVVIGYRRFRPDLGFVDEPEFIAWAIAASAGFDHRSNRIILNFSSIGANESNYDISVGQILRLPGLVEPEKRNDRIKEILSASKGYLGTKRMLFNNGFEIIKNENDMKKSVVKGGSGAKYGDYK